MLITAITRTIGAIEPNSGTTRKLTISPFGPVHVDGSVPGNPTPLSVTWISTD